MERFWTYNAKDNNYIPTAAAPLSAFPTIVDAKGIKVWCRACRCWENIAAFRHNALKAACGKLYAGPFIQNDSIFCYGYDIMRRDKTFYIRVQSQIAATNYRRLLENDYELDLNKKRLYKNGEQTFERQEFSGQLCKELTEKLLDEIGDEHKKKFGIKPTVSSSLKGFSAALGYTLCPFNVNFFVICRHWGLNPYDADFTSLSSGDTPTAENEMFASLGIKPSKSARKIYQKFPQGIISYAAAKDLGFTDANLLQKSANPKWYEFFLHYMFSVCQGQIDYTIREPLKHFVNDALALANQKTVWNSIDRTVNFLLDISIPNLYVTDAIQMYPGLAEHLTDREKRQVLSEGFNKYTHDFLLRRQNEIANQLRRAAGLSEVELATKKDEPFNIEQSFLDLEYKAGEAFKINSNNVRVPVPDQERYCFYVAKDPLQLKIIGSEMSNCVGWGYERAVRERRSTIVYAMHKGKYKICVEVTPDFCIRQAYGPRNSELKGDAYLAFEEWLKAKHITRRKAFAL